MLWIRLRFFAVGCPCGRDRVRRGERLRIGSQEPGGREGTDATGREQTATTDSTRRRRTPAERQARLRAQQLATRKARGLYEIARLTRELAEIAVEEYEEVSYPRDLAAAFG